MSQETEQKPTHIKSNHPAAFHSGEWALILAVAPAPDGKDCYIVKFDNGDQDFWRVDDPVAGYEFEVRYARD